MPIFANHLEFSFPNEHLLHRKTTKNLEKLNSSSVLQRDQKVSILLGVAFSFMLYVTCIYWWYRYDDILFPLALFPPKATPPFWHAIFIILVNGMDSFYICSYYIVTICLH